MKKSKENIKRGGYMKISWIRSKEDNENFNFFKTMGFSVIELDNLEKTDEIINNLIKKNCKTIVVSNEVASFSQDIIKKYAKEEEINIIIFSK